MLTRQSNPFVLLFLLFTLMGCEVPPGNNGKDIDVKSSAEVFSDILDYAGQAKVPLVVSLESSKDFSGDLFENSFALVLKNRCSIENRISSGKILVGKNSLNVWGDRCPVVLRVDIQTSSPERKVVARYLAKEVGFVLGMKVRGWAFSGKTQFSLVPGGSTRMQINGSGAIETLDSGAVSVQVQSSLIRLTGRTDKDSLIGSRVIRLGYNGQITTIKAELKTGSAVYELNGDRISEGLYLDYLSELGPVFSGLFNEAG